MINIIIHGNKGRRKTKQSSTYWYITIIKGDVLDMFDKAAKKIDKLLGYKKQTKNVKL